MKEWTIWLLLGGLSMLFGILALGNAVAVSIAITVFTGILFLIAGAFQTVAGFYGPGGWNRAVSILLGLLVAAIGLSFMRNPLEGVMSLALVVTIFIGTAGVLRLLWAFRMRETRYFWMMLVSGALSILLAGYILANFGAASTKLLGILLGIELLFNGLALAVLGLFLRAHSDEI